VKLEQSFDVGASPDTVWALLIDLERVGPCLPGAEITGRDDDGTYHGTFTVKLGPTTASYRGKLRFEELDDAARRAVMHATGQDKRGQGGATATIISTVNEAEGVTRVAVDTDFVITGKLARFGRGGMIEDISNRLLRDFASCLQGQLAAPATTPATDDSAAQTSPAPARAASKPVSGIGLFFGALWDRIKRLFGSSDGHPQ